jgi:hypothetical protein
VPIDVAFERRDERLDGVHFQSGKYCRPWKLMLAVSVGQAIRGIGLALLRPRRPRPREMQCAAETRCSLVPDEVGVDWKTWR